MAGLERIWWLKIYLASAILLFCGSLYGTQIENEVPYTTTLPTDITIKDDNSKRGKVDEPPIQTGRTTRILTAKETDEKFRLKPSGEVFKNTILLQVGNDSHNITENGSNHKNKYDDRVKKTSVNEEENNVSPVPQIAVNHASGTENTNVSENILLEKSNTLAKEQDDIYHTKREKYQTAKTQNIQLTIEKQPNKSSLKHQKEVTILPNHQKWNMNIKPIVLTLQHDKEVEHLAHEYAPIVFKMPPIIYHEEPIHTESTSNKLLKNHATHPQFQHQHHQHQQLQHHPRNILNYKNHYNTFEYKNNLDVPNPSQYYNEAAFNRPMGYRSEAVYLSPAGGRTLNSIPVESQKEHTYEAKNSVHFIFRKPSTISISNKKTKK